MYVDSKSPGFQADTPCEKCGKIPAINYTYEGRLCDECALHVAKRCDFCNFTPPAYIYPATKFAVIKVGEETLYSENEWAACEKCHDAIENKNWERVEDRALDDWRPYKDGNETEAEAREKIRKMHRNFSAHRNGEPYRIEVCDFCHQIPIKWRYPAKSFKMPMVQGDVSTSWPSIGDWAACDGCHELIENDKWDELGEKSIALDPKLRGLVAKFVSKNEIPPEVLAPFVKDTVDLFKKFREYRTGPAEPYQQEPPKPVVKIIKRSTNADYMKALETRAGWIHWAKGDGAAELWKDYGWEKLNNFAHVLQHGDTFFMDRHFCELVDHSRQCIPDDIKFEMTWMVRPNGWMWLAEPFVVPRLEGQEEVEKLHGKNDVQLRISAIGWRPLEPGLEVLSATGKRVVHSREVWFACFIDFGFGKDASKGFGAWSYFSLGDGVKLIDRVSQFEDMAAEWGRVGGQYSFNRADRRFMSLHEIRWVYAAMHLMSQRLAARIRRPTDRPTRKRIEREKKQSAPPFIEVVTLRRMENARLRDPKGNDVDWQWQWEVSGHWRNQYYPKEQTHKPKFIEPFVKGPIDKPFRPKTKVFLATR